MRWSFWLFVLAEFCRRYETKGTWRGACSGVPSKVQGQSSWGGQGKPHEHVSPWGETGFIDFLKVLQCVPLGQAYSQVRHYGGRRGGGLSKYFLIGSAQISWVARLGGQWGFQTPQPPWPRHWCVCVNDGHFEQKFWASDFLLCFVCFIDTGNMCRVVILCEMCYFCV